MQEKKGYKQTEVGAIPEDWILCEFQDVMTGFSSGQTPYREIKSYYTGDIPWITSGELNYKKIADTVEKITLEAVRHTNLKIVPEGTFLIAITGLEAAGTRGSCGITGIAATSNQSCMALYPIPGRLITDYLFHYYVKNGDLLAFKYCQGTKQQSYTAAIAKKLPIALPSDIKEQAAIATALSDMDALIAQTEQLIEKKKAIKQGVMQDLLKPKEGWVTKKLGEVCDIYQPITISADKFTNEGYLVYGANGVVGYYSDFNHKDWQVMITCRGSTCGTVNKSVDYCWITGNAMVMNVDSNEKMDKQFFYYLLTSQDFTQTITGSGQPQIVRSPLANFWVAMPKEKEEQKSIGLILMDIDSSIDKSMDLLQKLKLQKLGMMQALLTGKIRLV
jgi:type I restriction enzyme S subunit